MNMSDNARSTNEDEAGTANSSTPPSTTLTQSQKSVKPYTPRDKSRYNNFSKIETGDINKRGENESFGYVIGTRNEKLTHGKVYNDFKDFLLIYVVGEFKNGDDILCIVRELKDPEEDLKREHGAKRPEKTKDSTYEDFAIE